MKLGIISQADNRNTGANKKPLWQTEVVSHTSPASLAHFALAVNFARGIERGGTPLIVREAYAGYRGGD